MNRGERRARAASSGGWGEVGVDSMTRYSVRKPDQRRAPLRCPFDCPNKATHVGMANGVALTAGCEFHVAAWVRA